MPATTLDCGPLGRITLTQAHPGARHGRAYFHGLDLEAPIDPEGRFRSPHGGPEFRVLWPVGGNAGPFAQTIVEALAYHEVGRAG
jgi:hypothetical protein